MKHCLYPWLLRSCVFTIICFNLSFESFCQYYAATIYKEEPGMTSNRIYGMTQLPNGEIWFATQEGINIYDGFDWISFPDTVRFLPYNGHVRITSTPDSSVYVLGVNNRDISLKRYQAEKWTQIDLPEAFINPTTTGNFEIAVMASSQRADRLIISNGHHLYDYDGSAWEEVTAEFPEGSAYIHKIKNKGDSLFLATDKGLYLYHQKEFYPLLKNVHIYNLHYESESGTFYLLGADWVGSLKKGSEFEKLRDNEKVGLFGKDPISNIHKQGDKLFYSLNSPLHSYSLTTGKRQPILSSSFNKDYTCMSAMFDQEGNLWIATLRGAFKIANLNIYSYNKAQLVEDEVSAILEASNGDIYLGNNFGFNILKPDGEITSYQFPERFPQHRVMDIVEYEGTIYFAGHTAGIVSFKNGRLTFEFIETDLPRALDLQLYKGELLAAVNTSIYKKTPAGWESMMSPTPYEGKKPIVRKILWYEDQKYLLTPFGVYDCEKKQYYTSPNLDGTNVYTGLRYMDKILLGTTAGLAEIKEEKIVPATVVSDPLKKPVYALLLSRNNRLWVGTENGIFHKSKYGQLLHISKSNGLIGNEVNRNAFTQLRDGRILIGTDEGLSIYTPKENQPLPVPQVELTAITANDRPVNQDKRLAYDENQLRFFFRGISFYNEKMVNYRVRLDGFEEDWQYLPYHNQRSILYTNVKPGAYRFLLQARVGDGKWSQIVHSGSISILPAFYNTLWFRVLLVGVVIGIVLILVKFRSRHLKSRNESLEKKINEKTEALNEQNAQLIKTINDLKSMQGQLIQSEKLASMGHLTAGIAHEMNNPLNYIRGGAECLKQNLKEITDLYSKMDKIQKSDRYKKEYEYLIDESKQLIDAILSGAEKSMHIVKSLKSFTADAQNFYSFVDMEQEVETALTLLNNQIGFRITINKFFGNVPRLECYPARINQMLVNILLNAVQAITGEGEITIRIYRKDARTLALVVTDSGQGIPSEDEEKVFEPFFTTKDNNAGLGLTIVKSIVQDHRGEIRFLSNKGHGTKVMVILPLQQTFHPELEALSEN